MKKPSDEYELISHIMGAVPGCSSHEGITYLHLLGNTNFNMVKVDDRTVSFMCLRCGEVWKFQRKTERTKL